MKHLLEKDKEIDIWLDFDCRAPETLTCALLDILNANKIEDKQINVKIIAKTIQDKDRLTVICKEVTSLVQMLRFGIKINDAPLLKDKDFPLFTDDRRYKFRKMNPDADAYLCWYTNLREMLRKHPDLESDVYVYPLPGGGFRGDWYLGIVNGSVSIHLGRKVIDLLTRREEEYKRLVRGVGLPTREAFYRKESVNWKPLKLWANSQQNLSDIHSIYRNALSRKDIDDYLKIRGIIGRAMRKMVFEINDINDIEKIISDIVSRISWMAE